MSAREDINRLYEQWVRLTRAEGEAIRTADWPNVKKLQADKSRLQNSINHAQERLDREDSAAKTSPSPFHVNFGRLISLENRNSELLKIQLNRFQTERRQLDFAQKNLQRIRQSYAHVQPVAEFQCLS